MTSADVVVGIRHVERTLFRHFVSAVFHGMIRVFFSFDAVDFCGFYTIRRGLLQGLPLKSDNVFLNIEVPIMAARQGGNIKKIDIDVKPRLSGTSKVGNFRTLFKNFTEILRIRFSRR
jgi:hypothetical protein